MTGRPLAEKRFQAAFGKASERRVCPRCDGWVKEDRDEWGSYLLCLACGWTRDLLLYRGRAKGVEYRIRYEGAHLHLTETVLRVKVERVGREGFSGRLLYIPACPWCIGRMEQVSQSGKRRRKNESRYACVLGHRISIFEYPDRVTWA